MHFTITSEHSKYRLDKFLKEHFPEPSRAYIQKLIAQGNVTVNGKHVSAHHFLKTGDAVEAEIEPPAEIATTANPSVVFGVLAETPDYLVIEKPAGIIVHQNTFHRAPDALVNGLIARFPEIQKIGDDPLRPGIVHRLDAGVSGVMVIARNQEAFESLKKQFQTHTMKKGYVALVHGRVVPDHGVIEFSLARKGARMVARPKGGEGKSAVTEYETLQNFREAATLLKISTKTGRTHQIRVHLFAKGNPIIGDPLYEAKLTPEGKKIKNPGRVLLHACELGFTDIKGKWQEFESPLPNDFQEFILILKK
ncbi:MAG: RluA family pseudouridine synthase [Patescibacteria group bacterium]